MFGAASALHAFGAVDRHGTVVAERIAGLAKTNHIDPMWQLQNHISKHVEGWDVRPMYSFDPLGRPNGLPEGLPIVMQIEDSSGDRNHCVSIVGGYIFDANKSHTIGLTKEGLDSVCLGSCVFAKALKTYMLIPGKSVMKQLRKRKRK